MMSDKVLPVVLSVVVIVLVAIVQEKSRFLAAILASMPLTAPLAMWVVFSSTNGDHEKTAQFTASLAVGVVATLVFVAATWFGLRRQWSFPAALGAGAAGWAAFVACAPLVARLLR